MTKTTPIADLRGKSCGPANSKCPVDHLVDLVSRSSFGRSPGIDSRIPAGSRLCGIRSIPGLQSCSSLPLQGTTESFLAKTGQHGALFG